MAITEAVDSAVQVQAAQERAVGISVCVEPRVSGFRCTIKQRYTDFLVNEILPNGEVLHLAEISTGGKRKHENGVVDANKRTKIEVEAKLDTPVKLESETQAAGGGEQPNGHHTTFDVKPDDVSASRKAVKDEAIASISVEDSAALKALFGASTAESIISLYGDVVANPARKARDHASIKSEPLTEKSRRTEAHVLIRRVFNSRLETTTVQSQDQSAGPPTIVQIKAAPPNAAPNSRTDVPARDRRSDNQRGKQNWQELGGEYLHFTLYKENKDTMEVINFLAAQLKMHFKHFSFAGTKDRRGVTVQRVAIYRTRREQLEPLNRMARGRSWRLGGPWEYKQDGLELGMLSGNEFLLTLRDVRCDGEAADWDISRRLDHARTVAKAAARSMHQQGYLNYYGLQRFGSYSTGTHTVGMKMLKGDLKGAVEAILAYDASLLQENQPGLDDAAGGQVKKVPQEDIDRATGIHEYKNTGNVKNALRLIPARFAAERGMITHLGKHNRSTNTKPNANDYQGAIMQIQRNMRLMYVHAYQSFVWNTIVGKRWELFGNSVAQGDLVVVGEKEIAEGVPTAKAELNEVDENGEPIIHPSASAAGYGEPAVEADDPFVRARPLSKDEAESGRFTIFDLVLPLPGYDVIYPGNEVGKLYEEFMASEQGGGLDPHNMRRALKDVSLSGGYRKIMSRPLGDGIEVDVRAYSGADEQMVETDLEKLDADAKAASQSNGNGDVAPDKVAIVLKMQLATSQYATMALRELTKGGAVGYRPEFAVTNR